MTYPSWSKRGFARSVELERAKTRAAAADKARARAAAEAPARGEVVTGPDLPDWLRRVSDWRRLPEERAALLREGLYAGTTGALIECDAEREEDGKRIVVMVVEGGRS